MSNTNEQLQELIKSNISFHAIVENETRLIQYGSITFNAEVKNGKVQLQSINIVRNKRWRY